MNRPPIIFPLGIESLRDNLELKIALRSIDCHGYGYGDIIIAAQKLPTWIKGVELVEADDPLPQNKDGNIIRKVIKAIPRDVDHFVFCCDDHVLLKDTQFDRLSPIYNRRGKSDFHGGNRWQKRVIRTFDYLEGCGIHLDHNYESHTPQLHDAKKVLSLVPQVDYQSGVGYTINTLFYGLEGVTDGVNQNTVKVTCETADSATAPFDRQFLGYNDSAFLNGLAERLIEVFPLKSRFEK